MDEDFQNIFLRKYSGNKRDSGDFVETSGGYSWRTTKESPDNIVKGANHIYDALHEDLLDAQFVHTSQNKSRKSDSFTQKRVLDTMNPRSVVNMDIATFMQLPLVQQCASALKSVEFGGKEHLYPHEVNRRVGTEQVNEAGVEHVIKLDIVFIHNFFERNDLLAVLPCSVGGEAIGKNDIVLAANGEAVGIIEIKPHFYNENKTNMNAKYDEELNTQSTNKSGEKQFISPIAQTYDYMCINGFFYGLLSSGLNFWIFIRDCHGNLVIVEPFSFCHKVHGEELPSPAQLLTIFMLLTNQNAPIKFHECLLPCKENCPHAMERSNGVTTWKTAERTTTIATSSDKTPIRQSARLKNKPPTNRNGDGMQQTIRARPLTRDDIRTRNESKVQVVPCGKYKKLTNNCVLEVQPNHAIKFIDALKESDDRVDTFFEEIDIYNRLKHLQGTCIPKFVGQSYYLSPRLLSIVTTYEGRQLTNDDLSVDMYKKCLNIVQQLHYFQVVHQDLAMRNIVMNDDGVVKIIDFGHAIILQDYHDHDYFKQKDINQLKNIFNMNE